MIKIDIIRERRVIGSVAREDEGVREVILSWSVVIFTQITTKV